MDLVFPNKNESAILSMAKKLDLAHEQLCFCYDIADAAEFKTLKKKTVEFGVNLGQIINEKTRKTFPVLKIIMDPSDSRFAFEQTKADIVCDVEHQKKPDFMHHRASGLNPIIARIGTRRGKKLGICLSSLLSAPNTAQLLGRLKQNIMIARKAGLEVVFFSGARDEWGLRSQTELNALKSILK